MNNEQTLIPIEQIQYLILNVRGQNVIIAADLARLYGVATKVLNQAVKRNSARFPEDFVFQLTEQEKAEVVTNCDHLQNLKYSSTLPFAFTEHGTIMAANLLNSTKAVGVSVYIVRAFVELRRVASLQEGILARLSELEEQLSIHGRNIKKLAATIHQLMAPPAQEPKKVGFHWE